VSDAAVVFDGVWKKFRRGERHDTLRDLLPSMIKGLASAGQRRQELQGDQEFWALKDVSFEVRPGQALGVIGPNGAGKSTTLKLLTRILRPNRGYCAVRGRVGALIEVAAGFHPDLTGRENIFLQGAIMGMGKEGVRRRMDEIIDFAGVGDFVDTPVKRYSSGMNARLGFSIAAHLDPDVLICDEVLSVGDVGFQARCIERMHAFRKAGVTIVFVSHNLQAISDLCDRTLFIKRELKAIGPTAEVLQQYVDTATAHGHAPSDDVSVVSAEFTGEGSAVTVSPGAKLSLRVTYEAHKEVDANDLTIGFMVHRSTDLLVVYDGNFTSRDLQIPALRPGVRFSIDYTFAANLVRGQYHADCYVYHNPTLSFLGRLSPAGLITVAETRTNGGIADLQLRASMDSARDLAGSGKPA